MVPSDRIALSEGSTRLGAFFNRRRKQRRVPKRRASLKNSMMDKIIKVMSVNPIPSSEACRVELQYSSSGLAPKQPSMQLSYSFQLCKKESLTKLNYFRRDITRLCEVHSAAVF
jgi:hypothetical protein